MGLNDLKKSKITIHFNKCIPNGSEYDETIKACLKFRDCDKHALPGRNVAKLNEKCQKG